MIQSAVILAGGKGTRLQSVSNGKPKPLVPIHGRPFLEWQLLYLKNQGLRDIVLLVSHEADQIETYFQENPIEGLSITCIREITPLGTGGALTNAITHLPDEFVLLNGDSFLPIALKPLFDLFAKAENPFVLAVVSPPSLVPVPANLKFKGSTVLEYKKDGGTVAGFNGVDAGVYILIKAMLSIPHPKGSFDLSYFLQAAIQKKAALAFPTQQKFYDIGTPERLEYFKEHLYDYFKDTV